MPRSHSFKDETGNTYGFLTAQSFSHVHRRNAFWLCKCACGVEKTVMAMSLRNGHTKSCGCAHVSRITRHGLYYHPLYRVWSGIKRRCGSKREKEKHYVNITMCAEWSNDFMKFYSWAIENGWAKGLQIDRIDFNGHYTPENCRIVTPLVNQNNKRNNRRVTANGITRNVSEWSRITGLNITTIRERLRRGCSDDEAINHPKHFRK